ncbi:MAG: hypothetical protein MRY63_11315 [Neomegalonema sp.]|nr:hypothetical protein [Neomegalonema sp.]
MPAFLLRADFSIYILPHRVKRTNVDHTASLPLANLAIGRVHEAYGPSAWAFAVMQAAQSACSARPVVWISRRRSMMRLNAQGLAPLLDPALLLLVQARDQREALWAMEEALRHSATLVIADLEKPADLTSSRRLQLAAETGGATGLCLLERGLVTNAAETRWQCLPLQQGLDSTAHFFALKRNKRGILGVFKGVWDAGSRSVHVVSASGSGVDAAPEGAGERGGQSAGGLAHGARRMAAFLAEQERGQAGASDGNEPGGCESAGS